MAAAEISGYFLHRLLHSHRIKYLSQSHMIHHLRLYGPKMPQVAKDYKSAVMGRMSIFNIGMEWYLGVFALMLFYSLIAWLIDFPLYLTIIFIVVNLTWAKTAFDYMHDAMHIEDFWMIKNHYFAKWFLYLRGKHQIHHMDIDDIGRMNSNYGICFFVVDRIMGTHVSEAPPFNEKGFKEAEKRYKNIIN